MLSPPALASLATRHPWRVVCAWIVVLLGSLLIIATLLGDALDADEGTTNNPESVRAFDLLDEHLPDSRGATELVVVRSAKFTVDDPQYQTFLAMAVREATRIDGIRVGTNGAAPAAEVDARDLPRSKDGHALLVPISRTGDVEEEQFAQELIDRVRALDREPHFEAHVTGAAIVSHDVDALSQSDLEEGELQFGLPAALLVLLIVVGTAVGALLPLVLSGFAIITALALAALVGLQFDLSVFLVNMLSGMGLALGVDYSLFVLSRYREERVKGASRDEGILIAGRTASRAVLFSGMTFVIALLGMLLVQTTIMRSLALGAILVGLTSVAAALTLLPALLRLLGDNVDRLRIPVIGQRVASPDADWRASGWARVIRAVMQRPWRFALVTTALLLTCTIPLLGIKTGAGGVSTLPADLPSREGYAALTAAFPDAAYAPARVVILADDVRKPAVRAGADHLERLLAADDRFGAPARVVSPDNRLLKIDVPVGADSLDTDAVAAVRKLRADLVPAAFAEGGKGDGKGVPLVQVSGETAFNIDYFDVMRAWVIPVFAMVLGLSFLLLMVVFRSIVVPIKAIILNLLSVGATYGLLVLVFQHGIGADLLGFQQVDVIEAWVPLFLFSVLFGLSMDYHMFLLTRIRERWERTGDTREAVEWGVSTTSRLITGAALIIVAVFTGFARGDLVMFQQMGFGIAVALILDATIVRGVLLPATMVLLGDRNWYLPRWLEWLPRVNLDH